MALKHIAFAALIACAVSATSFADANVSCGTAAGETGTPSGAFQVSNAKDWVDIRGEKSFSVISPQWSLRYGEAHKLPLGPFSIPQDIISEFKDKTMAITGYTLEYLEEKADGTLESVGVNKIYNHHYVFHMFGEKYKGNAIKATAAAARRLGSPSVLQNDVAEAQVSVAAEGRAPNVQVFAAGNGGEYICSFHGLAEGYAQLIHSPSYMVLVPHTINVWYEGEGDAPLPKTSVADPDAKYSGLLECPCSNRRKIDKEEGTIDGTPALLDCRPLSDIFHQKNPSCDIHTYVGGMRCCEHGMSLLDSDQDNSQNRLVNLRARVTFRYEDPSKGLRLPHSHQTANVYRLYYQTEWQNFEYDVPRCAKGTPPQYCVHTATAEFSMRDMFTRTCDQLNNPDCAGMAFAKNNRIRLVYAGPHVHVGGISLSLYNVGTGELICQGVPVYGKGKGLGNEEGYLSSIPPCVWSRFENDPNYPTAPWFDLDTRLRSIAQYNNSAPHLGVMASWQMQFAYV